MTQNAHTRVPFTTWAVVALASALWIFFGSIIVPSARAHDFLNLYSGASLAGEGRFVTLHDTAVQLAEERRFEPRTDHLVPFVRPHFYAALLLPLGWLSFSIAFWIWLAIQAAVYFACWRWGLKQFGPDALAIGALFLPAALGIAHGQDCVFMLAVSIGAYHALRSGRPLLSGAILALGLAKFHLFLLWPLALIVGMRWRMLAGFALGGAIEGIASLALGGLDGARSYIALLTNRDLDHLSPSPELMVNGQSIAANLFDGNAAAANLMLGLTAGLWLGAVWRAPLWRWWSATAAAGLLLVPHVYGYDATLLLLPIWLVLFESGSKPARIAALAASTPIPYLMSLADKPYSVAGALAVFGLLATLAAQAANERLARRSAAPVLA